MLRTSIETLPGCRHPSVVRARFPILDLGGDEFGPGPVVMPVEDGQVVVPGAQVHPRRPGIEGGFGVRPGGPIAGSAVLGLELDLTGSVDRRSVWFPGTLPAPGVVDARGALQLPGGLAPVSGGQRAALLPGASVDLQHSVAIACDAE